MPIGYKYVERAADSYVNYAEIGKNMSNMLNEEQKIREEKKAAIDEATRQYGIEISNAPQGEFQDGNKVTTDFMATMQEQRLMDDRLLKSGKLSLKDYTLRRQNNVDGTKDAFDLLKIYQEKAPEIQKGLADGSLQAFNGFNMANAEGIKDFKNIKLIVDQTTGRINYARTKFNEATGVYDIVEGADNTQPVSVLKGKILQQVPTFMVDDALDKTAKGWSERIREQQKFATKYNLGNITTLTGDAINKIADPEAQATMRKWDDGVNKYVDSLLVHPYDLMSVLTENTGKYGAESYTFDKSVADADRSKILLKANPSNMGLGVIDENGKYFNAQKEEAATWIKSQLNNKFDDKIQSEEKGQVSDQTYHAPVDFVGNAARRNELEEADVMGENVAKILTGKTAEEVQQGINYAKGLGINAWTDDKGYHLIPVDKQGNDLPEVFYPRGTDPKKVAVSLISAINSTKGLGEKLIRDAANKYISKNPLSTHVIGKTVEVVAAKPVATVDFKEATSGISPDTFKLDDASFAVEANKKLESLGLKIISQNKTVDNYIDIADEDGNILYSKIPTNIYIKNNRSNQYTDFIDKLKKAAATVQKNKEKAAADAAKAAAAGAKELD